MKKRSFIAALAMLVVSAIVLTSATFAWFSMAPAVTVNEFNANVASADGLSISANNNDFGQSVSLEQIKTANQYYNIVDSDGAEMFPVSGPAIASGTWYDGYQSGSAIYVSALTRGTTSGENIVRNKFYCFPLYIKQAGSEDVTVSLSGTTITDATQGKEAVKSARLAIVSGGTTPSQTAATKIYVPNNTGDSKYQYVSGVNSDGHSPVTTDIDSSKITTDVSDLSFTVASGNTSTTVWVMIWLEGTDADCSDNLAAGASLRINLTFTKVSA